RDPYRGERERGQRNRIEREAQQRRGDARAERRPGRRLGGRVALDEIVPRAPLREPAGGEDRGQHGELDEQALRTAAAGNLVRAFGERVRQLRPALGEDGAALVQVRARAFQRRAQPHEPHHEAAAGLLRGGGVLFGVLAQLAREHLARLRVGELREQRVDVGRGEVFRDRGRRNGRRLFFFYLSKSRNRKSQRAQQREPKPRHSTSTMHSISTGMPIGSEPMPTAERACLPLSPSTSTNRSEQPLITFGWSVNSGTAFTMPSTFTTRFTLSRLPSSVRITASRSRPTERACWYACSTVTSRPTLPTGRWPCASMRGPLPARNSRLPVRTALT